ncbi:MAG: hypothetical protein ABIP77_04610 [Candidatus Limnocylindrales bacterium]
MAEQRPGDRRRARLRGTIVAVVLGVAATTFTGCTLSDVALDGPIAVNLHIRTTATSVEVDAPGWFAATTGIHLCPVAPPVLPAPGPARDGWKPGPPCHDYGRQPSVDGLTVSLPLADLAGETSAAFAAADDWYLLLLDLDGDRVTAAIRSSFKAPADVAAS